MTQQLSLAQSLGETYRRLSRREKASFALHVSLRYLVSLLDVAGITLFGALALLATNGSIPEVFRDFLTALSLERVNRESLLGIVALTVMSLFLLKGLLAAWLTWLFASSMARIEKAKVVSYTAQVIEAPSNRHNAFSEPDIAHALTVGVAALFPKTLGNLGMVISELLSVISVIALLAVVSPAVTVFAAVYFGIVGSVLQAVLGNKIHRESTTFASSQVESGQNLREALFLYPELKLSGNLAYFIEKFHLNRGKAIESMARILFIGAMPRYVVEAAFMAGAFALAIFVFSNFAFTVAAAIFSIFIASGGRIAPSLITLMNSLTALRQAVPDVAQSMKVLQTVV